jgi:hypothetical protein
MPHKRKKKNAKSFSQVQIRHSGATHPIYLSPPLSNEAAHTLAKRKRDEADRRGWNIDIDVIEAK